MTAASRNITIQQGDTFQDTMQLLDSAGDPIDFTGFTAKMQIRSEFSLFVPLLYELNTSPGAGQGLITLDSSGNITRLISAADTALFTFGDAVYALVLIDPSGKRTTRIQGVVTRLPQETA